MHNTTDEKRWPDSWLKTHGVPVAGAFPSRAEYAFALEEQLQATLPLEDGPGREIGWYATSGLSTVAMYDDAHGRFALCQLQYIAREVL